ncbi:cyclin-dependent kinase 11B-like [Haliotis cracherodii]|uniref:cyclin-dependent kinase 11B-like n=1 Tax=Haliotis cracherodii TaxID=6455 RepID=UPI0039EB1EE9
MSDDADSSYEQGELEPSPDHHRASDNERQLSLSPQSQEAIVIDDPEDQDFSDKDRSGGEDGDGLDIKPPQTHAGRKEKSRKHKHKEERRRERDRRDREREYRDRERGHSGRQEPERHRVVQMRDRREHREQKEMQVREMDREWQRERELERERQKAREAERERKEKEKERRMKLESREAREMRKRQESQDERERLEQLEREKQRARRIREERERARRKEEERRQAQQARSENHIKRQKVVRTDGERVRSRSRDRRHQREVENKGRSHRKEGDHRGRMVGPHTPEEEDEEEDHREVHIEAHEEYMTDEEEEEEEEEEEVEEEEEEEKEVDHSEEEYAESVESQETESDNSSSTSSSKVSEGVASNGHHEKVRSKFDDQSENESETESVDMLNSNNDVGYIADSPPPSPLELEIKLPPYFPALQGCRSVEEFSCLNRIEEGTYGVVYRAKDKKTNEIVALKRLKMEKEKEGFPITSLREINTLLKAQHYNIVTVREIVVGSNMDKIYIVMDYVEHDLKSLMETMKQPFLVGEVKTLMQQLLRAVAHLHDNWILHRDLKTSNLLLSHKGILKVGDFGLAREYGSPLKQYTPIVVTLWYRAPELLLGTKLYTCAIDMWSVGCIFAEFLTMKALWPGKSEIDQLNRIFKDLGTPNKKIWPGVEELPGMKKCTFTDYPYNTLRNRFGSYFTDVGFDLMNRFLTYNPTKRITSEEALSHDYFKESPQPVDPSMFPTWPAKSEQPRKHQSSPKPPSGGKAYSKLLGDDDESLGFHMANPVKGASAQGPGFLLKFGH